MQEKGLMAWFRKRHESIAVKRAGEHAGKLVSASIELLEAIKYASHGMNEEGKKALHAMNTFEKDADHIENLIADEVGVADLEPRAREYLMRMIRHQDYAVDWIKEAGMNLEILIDLKLKCPDEIWMHLILMGEKLVECTKALQKCMELLAVNPEDVKEHEKIVEELEHKIDDIYFNAKKDVLRIVTDARTVIVLREILHGMENSADNCKDTGDMIR
ncbi:MAG: DUF47 domain-containing protein, partial [Thermoplasmata archaeon]